MPEIHYDEDEKSLKDVNAEDIYKGADEALNSPTDDDDREGQDYGMPLDVWIRKGAFMTVNSLTDGDTIEAIFEGME